MRVLAVTPADSDRASTWTSPSRRASQRLSSRWTGHPGLDSTTPETRAIEPDDVELGGVGLDGPDEGAAAGRTPHEVHAKMMPTAGSSHLTRGPGRRIVVITQTWTSARAIRFRRRDPRGHAVDPARVSG